MSHKGIRLLIENTAKSLGDDIQFTYARTSDFNQIRDKRYPFISLSLLIASASYTVNNTSNYMKVWSINMAFYELDKAASIETEYALLLDSSDILLDSFLQKLNFFVDNEVNSRDIRADIIIQAINQTAFVKATADILTGQLLTFQIVAPDNWDYCADGC